MSSFTEDQLMQGIPQVGPAQTGLLPVLPSLAKPQPKPEGLYSGPGYPGVGPTPTPAPQPAAAAPATPFTALPPVTTQDPTPAQKAISTARTQLENDQNKPSFTAGLWEKTKGKDSVLGKIGHIGAGILRGVDIAGEIAAPGIAKNIPGTGLNRWANIQRDQASLAAAEGTARTEAATEKDSAEAAKARDEVKRAGQPKPKEEKWTGVTTKGGKPVLDKEGHALEREENSGEYRYSTLGGIQLPPDDEKPDTQTQNKEEFQRIIGNISAMGYKHDPANLNKSVEAAYKAGKLNEADYKTATGYLAGNQTPSNTFVVNTGEKQFGHNLSLEGREVIVYGPDGKTRTQMPYAEAQRQGIPDSQLAPLHPNEAQKNRDNRTSFKSTAAAMKTYRNDFKANVASLTTGDRDAMRVLTTNDTSGKTAGLLSGMFDDIPLVGPLNAYATKLLQGTMTSDQYENLSPAGKKLVSDYFTAAVENLANMKAVMGSMARNPEMIKVEMHNIPLPYLDWGSADATFNNYRDRLNNRAESQVTIFGEK